MEESLKRKINNAMTPIWPNYWIDSEIQDPETIRKYEIRTKVRVKAEDGKYYFVVVIERSLYPKGQEDLVIAMKRFVIHAYKAALCFRIDLGGEYLSCPDPDQTDEAERVKDLRLL